jgi:hypothetical protein
MMRTRFTKVLALILALVMTIGLLPMSAMATRDRRRRWLVPTIYSHSGKYG